MQGMETIAYSFISYGIHSDVVYGKWELIDLWFGSDCMSSNVSGGMNNELNRKWSWPDLRCYSAISSSKA
jgi:hypothetical protein